MNRKTRLLRREQAEARRASGKARRQAQAMAAAVVVPSVSAPTLSELLAQVRTGFAPVDPVLRPLRDRWPRTTPERKARLRHVVAMTERHAPRAAVPESLVVLWHLSALPWIRDPETFVSRGKAARTVQLAFVRHLVVRYDVPRFLYGAFDAWHDPGWIALFVHLATGGSLRAAVRDGRFGAPLTRRAAHQFLSARAGVPILEALRMAQATTHGADLRIAQALAASHLGQSLGREDFWDTVIGWFARQPMLDPSQVGPMVDYLHQCIEDDEHFTIGGRSVAALMRGMETWHAALTKQRHIVADQLPSSGLEGRSWTVMRHGERDRWAIREIVSTKGLADEGRAQRHCVLSYRCRVVAGTISIWSLTLNGSRKLTVEVDLRARSIVQARGRANRPATEVERKYLGKWAADVGLTSLSGA